MATNLTDIPLMIWEVNLAQINDVLRRIQDELDTIKGLRGDQSLYADKVYQSATVKYKDANGEVLHGFGSVGL